MSYRVFLSNKADKQYRKLDSHIRSKFKSGLLELEKVPYKGLVMSGKHAGLRYIKIIHKG